MRTFYIFNINDNFYSLFKSNEIDIYKTIKEISNISKEDILFGYNIFNQVCSLINNKFIDKRIFIDYHTCITYTKKDDTHIYNDINKNEIAYMQIKTTYIIIKSNKDYPSFFKILSKFNYNLFVCDFKNKDYFFLKNAKILVK